MSPFIKASPIPNDCHEISTSAAKTELLTVPSSRGREERIRTVWWDLMRPACGGSFLTTGALPLPLSSLFNGLTPQGQGGGQGMHIGWTAGRTVGGQGKLLRASSRCSFLCLTRAPPLYHPCLPCSRGKPNTFLGCGGQLVKIYWVKFHIHPRMKTATKF